jgi:hypothetical protein
MANIVINLRVIPNLIALIGLRKVVIEDNKFRYRVRNTISESLPIYVGKIIMSRRISHIAF